MVGPSPSPLPLPLTWQPGYAGILRRSCCGGGRLRMMSTAATSSSIEPRRISPWLMLSPAAYQNGGGDEAAYNLYSLASNKVTTLKKSAPPPPCAEGLVKLVGSSHGWLASFNVDNQHIFLSNPITNRYLKLPDIHTLPQSLFYPNLRTIVDKIILTSSPAAAECRAVMTLHRSGMALWHPTSGKWNCFGDALNLYDDDLVYSSRHKRLFCACNRHANASETLESWDLTDPDSPTKDWDLDIGLIIDYDFYHGKRTRSEKEAKRAGVSLWVVCKYLVFAEESDQLFLVIRHVLEMAGRDGSFRENILLGFGPTCYPYKTFAFDVYEIDQTRKQLSYIDDGSLNGLAMFVGTNHAFALPAAKFPELKPDSIYFTDGVEFTPLGEDDGNYGGHDIGIFNYKDRSFSSVYYSCHASDFTRILPPPIWFTPNSHPN